MNRRAFLGRSAAGAALAALSSPFVPRAKGVARMQTPPPRKTGWVSDIRFREHFMGNGHPESSVRLETIDSYMALSGVQGSLVPLNRFVDPDEPVLAVHSRSHRDEVFACETTGPIARLAAGAVLGAVAAVHERVVDNAFCAIRPPGHHAFNNGPHYDGPCKGQGFCYIGNVAVAARYAQQVLGYERILIIDWDYHYGNGTAWAFAQDPTVLFFSTHDWHSYPGSGDPAYTGEGAGEGYTINVHLDCASGDTEILAAWDEHLLERANDFKPQFVLISAGFDSRTGDSLGCFDITDSGFAQLTRKAMAIADTHAQGRIVSVLEGGYNPDGLARAVVAHTATLAGLDWSDFEMSRVRNRFGLTDIGEPYVAGGVLHFPELARYDMVSLELFTLSGRKITAFTREQLQRGRLALRPLLPGAGSYYLLFKRRSGESLAIDFTLM